MGKPSQGHAQSSRSEFIAPMKRTGGSEPSQYPQEEKAIAIPSVAASERGRAQTVQVSSPQALPARGCGALLGSGCGRSGKLQITSLAEGLWNEPPKRVKAP